jgi:hypothetical protein
MIYLALCVAVTGIEMYSKKKLDTTDISKKIVSSALITLILFFICNTYSSTYAWNALGLFMLFTIIFRKDRDYRIGFVDIVFWLS